MSSENHEMNHDDARRSMKVFSDLGNLIESRWREKTFDEAVFPSIAAAALTELNPAAQVDPWDIVQWVHDTPDLPQQMDVEANFGDPPITVFVAPEFFIDVYFWLDGTTSIHQHAFSGAFQVLLGSSVHSSYSFKKHRELNPHFMTGEISLNDVSLLTRGDVKEINPGPEFIHSLFHLERPSATITIRNYKTPSAAVQFRYQKPSLAYDPFFTDVSLKKKLQTVELMLRMKHPRVDQFIAALIDSSDFQTAYEVLKKAFHFLCHRELEEALGVSRSADRFQALLTRARAKHGELAELLVPVYEEEWRQEEITKLRATVKREDHRFFLALLLNVPERATILRLVKQRFPEHDAIELVVSWIKELAATRIFGSGEPNVLGVGDFDDRHLFVFKGLLEGLTAEEIKGRATKTLNLDTRREPPIEDLASHLQALPLFKGILATGQ